MAFCGCCSIESVLVDLWESWDCTAIQLLSSCHWVYLLYFFSAFYHWFFISPPDCLLMTYELLMPLIFLGMSLTPRGTQSPPVSCQSPSGFHSLKSLCLTLASSDIYLVLYVKIPVAMSSQITHKKPIDNIHSSWILPFRGYVHVPINSESAGYRH